ncbi:nucleophile aminohydrolase [Yarrowia lipolytica]|uniref:Nucleophile aminohydrolase n=1 Tax=Yarrowia lipolytica TaxID=4952 RepID=A0A371C1U8_YARLL|nr:nucleophile aminohydrolase [Yarrowia lipolytica]
MSPRFSRRSVVHSTKGMVASTQPLASAIGARVLDQGGNAAMAGIAVAAALNLLEPHQTGVGGDMFALFYDAKTKKVEGLNGSGRSPKALTVDYLRKHGVEGPRIPLTSPHTITVPGAVGGWCDIYERWGNKKLTMAEILEPVAQLAEEGAPISEVSAKLWKDHGPKLLKTDSAGADLLVKDDSAETGYRAPYTGEVFKNPGLAAVLREIGAKGRDGFYKGWVADSILEILQKRGSLMTREDLENHTSSFVEPIAIEIKDNIKLWELPPNGSGLVAIIAVGVIKALDRQGKISLEGLKLNSAEYLHVAVEALKFAFREADEYVSDPDHHDVSLEELLSETKYDELANRFDTSKIHPNYDDNVINPIHKSDTVYFAITDRWGNACSFIISIFDGFGSSTVPAGTGFCLQNRGLNFNLTEGTRNCLAGGKRPYHTIIPAMVTKGDDLWACYGVMGGFMQPQGHVQVLLNMINFGLDPQQALDAPRFCLSAGKGIDFGKGTHGPCSKHETVVNLEETIDPEVVETLKNLGHTVNVVSGEDAWALFGRGQVIRQDENGVYHAGSDPRGDGQAVPILL